MVALLASITACSKGGTPTSPTPPTPDTRTQAIFYTAIGASDGLGVGSSSACFLFSECPDGKGYVQILLARLRDGGRTVGHSNLSIPGSVLSKAVFDLAASVGRPIDQLAGNFIEREAPFVRPETTHVTIFAGGNDANTIAFAARSRGGSDPTAYVNDQVRQWGTDLEDLVARIRSRAPNARIVALNLPNLAASPYLAGNPPSEKSLMQRVAVGLSDRVNALTSRNVLVVDLMCDARLYLSSNYAADGFHPNDGGYAVFAELALPALRDGTSRAPSTTCAQRTVFP
ncbi:MAG: SGNH/GDSL hydrolase family protein [Acidobacteriota bacterium]|nr:SGNH/GDSL hydrolase family protein [Acidobacteriota bacterium]